MLLRLNLDIDELGFGGIRNLCLLGRLVILTILYVYMRVSGLSRHNLYFDGLGFGGN